MFRKKEDAKQDQPIPENTEEPELTGDSNSGFEKVSKSGRETKMANLTLDTGIKGTIKFGGAMRIDGNFDGELISDNGKLVVGKTGNVRANVKVRSAVIEGRVDGNIKASDKVEITQNAHLIGDLKAKTLVVAKGVVLIGKCNVNPEGTKTESQHNKERIRELTKEERVQKIILNRFINE